MHHSVPNKLRKHSLENLAKSNIQMLYDKIIDFPIHTEILFFKIKLTN